MHGRLKVKSSAQKAEEKRRDNQEKLLKYQAARDEVFKLRESADEKIIILTTNLLMFNCECNTFWNIRKEYIISKVLDQPEAEQITFFRNEQQFTVTCLKKNPKAYAVWLYREFFMNHLPNVDWNEELKLCDGFLKLDERNFHCWDYRRVVLKHIPSRTKELEIAFTDLKIAENFSNFSSWHYRTKLLSPTGCFSGAELDAVSTRKELDLVFNALFTDPSDQSAWFYYRWLHGSHDQRTNVVTSYALRADCLIGIVFNKLVSRAQLETAVVEVFSCKVRHVLKPVGGYKNHSDYWILAVVSTSFSPVGSSHIEVKIPDLEIYITLKMEDGEKSCFNFSSEPIKSKFAPEISESFPEVFEYDKNLMNDLISEEPENKWVLLHLVQMLRHDSATSNRVLSCLDSLSKVDPLRSMYYQDLKSEIIVENVVLDESTHNTKSIPLEGMSLTHVKSFSLFPMITSLNLSNNNLKSLRGLEGFVALKHLNIDKNQVTDLSALSWSWNLSSLYLSDNQLADLSTLESLVDSHLLVSLRLSGNPVYERQNIEDVKKRIQELFPRLEALDDQPI